MVKKIYNFEYTSLFRPGISQSDSKTEWIFLDKNIIVTATEIWLDTHYRDKSAPPDIDSHSFHISEMNIDEKNKYKKQLLEGEISKSDDYWEGKDQLTHKTIVQTRKILDVSEDDFKTEFVAAIKRSIKAGGVPNLSMLKKIYSANELFFYFPDLFPKEEPQPTFIGYQHIGDSKISGGDIIEGTKITGDTGFVKIGNPDVNSTPFSCCPFCGKKFNLAKTPNFCPYCGENIR